VRNVRIKRTKRTKYPLAPVEMCELSELSELSLASAKGISTDQSEESTFVATDRCGTRGRCIGKSIKRIRNS
jgi:hypothetical protein